MVIRRILIVDTEKNMSRVGKKPIEISEGVEIKIDGRKVIVKGPKGELSREVRPEVKIEINKGQIIVSLLSDSRQASAFWGLERALLQNMVLGVVKGFKKELEINGVGYRAKVENDKLILELGFTNPVEITIPEGLEVSVKGRAIIIAGIDKAAVGQFAAKARKVKPPDPYKGKGIRYAGEEIKLKPGKKAAIAAT